MEQQDIKIPEIEKTFRNVHELVQYVITQNKALLYSTERIRSLEDQLKLKTPATNSPSTVVVKSIPEALCAIEIQRLMDKAVSAPLDFEDTKRLDILVKNYYLAKDNDAAQSGKTEKKRSELILTDEELTKIAAK